MVRRFTALLTSLFLAAGVGATVAPGAALATYYANEVNIYDSYNYTGSLWHFDPAVYWNAAGNPIPWRYCKPLTGSENNRASSINNDSGFDAWFYESANCDGAGGNWFPLFAYHADPNLAVGQNMDNTISSVLLVYNG